MYNSNYADSNTHPLAIHTFTLDGIEFFLLRQCQTLPLSHILKRCGMAYVNIYVVLFDCFFGICYVNYANRISGEKFSTLAKFNIRMCFLCLVVNCYKDIKFNNSRLQTENAASVNRCFGCN